MSDQRPPIPFEIETIEAVRNYVAEMETLHDDFKWRWDAVVELLEVAGDTIGEPVGRSPLQRAWRFEVGDWSIAVAWHYLNGKIRIVAATL